MTFLKMEENALKKKFYSQDDIILKKANAWGENVWRHSITDWIKRPSHDFSYRKYVVDPSISNVLKKIKFCHSSFAVDLGCGDGIHTLSLRKELDGIGFNNLPILGLDLLEPLIKRAKENVAKYENIYFDVCDITDDIATKIIVNSYGIPDVIISIFTLQDIANLENVLKTVVTTLKKGGHLIAVFVHPNFAEKLLELGHIKTIESTDVPSKFISFNGVTCWQFRGLYPIVKEDASPFYLPYFQRLLQDYYYALESFGLRIKRKLPLMPSEEIIEKAQEQKITPFIADKWNVYWPTIIEMPSSMLIHAVKEA